MTPDRYKGTLDCILARAAPGGPLAPRGGYTYCDFALAEAGVACGYTRFDPVRLQMNDFARLCADFSRGGAALAAAPGTPPEWEVVDAWDAARHALAGRWCVAVVQMPMHGHGASVYPGPAAPSGSWGVPVPLVANVGRSVGVMPASRAFLRAHQPTYYLCVAPGLL